MPIKYISTLLPAIKFLVTFYSNLYLKTETKLFGGVTRKWRNTSVTSLVSRTMQIV